MMMTLSLTFISSVRHHSAALSRATASAAPLSVYEHLAIPLACFEAVTAAGCQHQPSVTGGGKAACETPDLLWVNTLLGNVKRALDGTCHAFRPKYAARYLAEFQYRFHRRYALAELPQRLLQAAALAQPLPRPLAQSAAA